MSGEPRVAAPPRLLQIGGDDKSVLLVTGGLDATRCAADPMAQPPQWVSGMRSMVTKLLIDVAPLDKVLEHSFVCRGPAQRVHLR